MSPSTGSKIVRKVFYTTGTAMAQADKIKEGLVDIAKSFKAGYHLMDKDSLPSSDQQLRGLYGYFGRIIFENIENKGLSFRFNQGFESLGDQAEKLLTGISPKEETPKEKEVSKTQDIVSPPDLDLAQIQSEEPLVRLKSIVQLSRMNTSQARQALLSHAKDPECLIRRVIVNCINPEGTDEEIFAIVKYINDPDEDVARIAIRKSAKTRNRLAFTYLISKLESENAKIRKEAIDALNLITGSDLGFNPTAGEGQRKEAVARWQQVWQDNQMDPKFLIDEQATHLIFKKRYSERAAQVEKKPISVKRHSEAKPKNHKTS